ncbi:uroporphyrinogen-III synthase [Novosphingobium sp. G106]|uniref:uroporphyrinogen-III synthase n=1 Tax=Novosphingobium sp. G106 TaxID=2849500 RepID=UPI001C2DB844|nr:uroporphyrinogen-III synthase [Novosphingobium sp. G106]MBV1690720.1 uroporphyrinogen-III synthase [Novosphingobium sp. G106]
MIPVVVIRPQPGCDATVEAARALGIDAQGFPLFDVCAVEWEPPAPDSFDAIVLGSANAPRHAGPALAAYAGKPTYAVGAVTAEVARQAGLDVVVTGTGGLKAVMGDLAPEHRRLLRLAGRERTMLIPPPPVSMQERVVYASEPLPLPEAFRALLRTPALVMLHSAEAAHRFAALCDKHHVDRSNVALAALGPRVARAAGSGWAALQAAEAPSDAAMLALARQMCQTPRADNCGAGA